MRIIKLMKLRLYLFKNKLKVNNKKKQNKPKKQKHCVELMYERMMTFQNNFHCIYITEL